MRFDILGTLRQIPIFPTSREMPANFPPSNFPTFRGNSITRRIPRLAFVPASEHQSSRGNSSEKMSKSVSARTERVISKARTVAFLFEPSLPLHERYLSYRRNNNGATRAEVYGKLNICSRRKKVIVSEYIFRWRRGTHSWRDALRDLINSQSCIRILYIYIYTRIRRLSHSIREEFCVNNLLRG